MFKIRNRSVVFIAIAVISLSVSIPTYSQDNIADKHRNTFNQYCVTCHNETLKTAGMMLDQMDTADIPKDTPKWEKVLRKLQNRSMPPAGLPRPEEKTYVDLVSYITNEIDSAARENPNPGRTVLHRLNRTEYANAIRDLINLEIDSTSLLPADDIGYGFDNIGDVLNVSPFLMERYLGAAAKISRLAIGDTNLLPAYQTYEVPRNRVQYDRMSKDLPFGSRGGLAVKHYFPVDGEYLIKVKLQTGRFDQIIGLERDRQLDILVDNKPVQRFTIEASGRRGDTRIHGDGVAADEHLEIKMSVDAGTHLIAATFIKDTIKEEGILKEPDLGLRNREQAF